MRFTTILKTWARNVQLRLEWSFLHLILIGLSRAHATTCKNNIVLLQLTIQGLIQNFVLNRGWLHSEMPLGDPLVIKKFEATVRCSYISGLHGIMWQLFKPMYLLPAPSLSVYTDWGEKNLPPAVLTSIPGSLSPVFLLDQEVDHSYPTLSLGYTTG
jgi:hypothetical protein